MKANLRRIKASRRHMNRTFRRGTQGNIIKSLAELVKNSDDAYFRTGKGGTIEIGYRVAKGSKGQLVKHFMVLDHGSGMSEKTLKEAYGEYGNATSGEVRNGAIGVGGKDALYGCKHCAIITTNKHTTTGIELTTDDEGMNWGWIDAPARIKEINSKVKGAVHKKRMADLVVSNGTCVMFDYPTNVRVSTLKKLSTYYTLRNILADRSRTVKLVDMDTGKEEVLKYRAPEGKVLLSESRRVMYNGKGVKIDILLRKGKDTDRHKDHGEMILVENDLGGILDNTLFGYELSGNLDGVSGLVRIHDWAHVYADELVLTDNRTGLDQGHEFTKGLYGVMREVLKPYMEEEKRRKGGDVDLSDSLGKHVKDTLRFVNKLAAEMGAGGSGGTEVIPPRDVEGLKFESDKINVPPGKKRSVRLYLAPKKVPPGSDVKIVLKGAGVSVNPSDNLVTPSPYTEYPPFAVLSVASIRTGGGAVITAKYGRIPEARMEVTVEKEEEHPPENGFAFMPKLALATPRKERELNLVIDPAPGTDTRVLLKSSDKLLVVRPDHFDVKASGKRVTKRPVVYSKEEVNAVVTASMGDKKADCRVQVTDMRKFNGFFAGYKADPHGEPEQRSRFEDGIIYVHTRHPVLRMYFGADGERLSSGDNVAIALFVDMVVQKLIHELAKIKLETTGNPMGPRETELEKIKTDLEYDKGAAIYGMMMGMKGSVSKRDHS